MWAPVWGANESLASLVEQCPTCNFPLASCPYNVLNVNPCSANEIRGSFHDGVISNIMVIYLGYQIDLQTKNSVSILNIRLLSANRYMQLP